MSKRLVGLIAAAALAAGAISALAPSPRASLTVTDLGPLRSFHKCLRNELADATCAATSTATTAAEATSNVLVIRGDQAIGRFPVYEDGGRLVNAIAVFGRPATLRLNPTGPGGYSCLARWPKLGLSIRFSTCVPTEACFRDATMTGPGWRTWKGLRSGDPRSRLHALYPGVKLRGSWLALLARQRLKRTEAALSARIVNGRVVAFRIVADSCHAFEL